MIIYFDGDNEPGTRENGLEKLTINDTLKLFFNSKNSHYTEKKVLKEIVASCKAEIELHELFAASQSIGFAIMADAAAMCAKDSSQAIALVSEDEHLKSIGRILQNRFPLAVIKIVPDIDTAWSMLGLLSVNGIDAIYNYLVEQFGFVRGGMLFDRMAQEFLSGPERTALAKMTNTEPIQ